MDTSALSPRRGGVAVLAVTLALVAAGVIAFVVVAGVLIVTGSQRVTIDDDRAPFLAAGFATAQSAALVFMTQGRGGLAARWLILIWLVTAPCVLVGTVLALAVAAVAGAPAVAIGMGRQPPGTSGPPPRRQPSTASRSPSMRRTPLRAA
jgi:hypothetical protein